MTMLRRYWFLLLFFFLSSLVQGMERLRLVDILNHAPSDDEMESLRQQDTIHLTNDDADQRVEELYLEQRLDHFSPSSRTTFRQRFFASNQYCFDTNDDSRVSLPSVVFLCVGGEGPAFDKSVLIDSPHCTGDMIALAKHLYENRQASVQLYALEHRYYGKSFPVFHNASASPVTNRHLKFLSSRQALADLAHFVQTMNQQYNHLGNRKWIAFGGSYPGMMAAYARSKYPHLIFGAVSNSAPVLPKLDFFQYNQKVAWDLQYPLVGGSDLCLETIRQGHAQLVDQLHNNQTQTVAAAFHVCNATSLHDLDNVRVFLGDGVIEIPAQSNDPACPGHLCNIAKLCDFVTTKAQQESLQAWQILSMVARLQRRGSSCLVVDWKATLDELQNPGRRWLRSWLWQTCTEFGFYQTCQDQDTAGGAVSPHCPYASGYHPLEMDLQICEYAFGIPPHLVHENLRQTKEEYGGWKLDRDRILSVNGDVDPWSVLAVPSSIVAKGASHHFWTHKVQESDGPEVERVRNVIYQTVQLWLYVDDDESSSTNEFLLRRPQPLSTH